MNETAADKDQMILTSGHIRVGRLSPIRVEEVIRFARYSAGMFGLYESNDITTSTAFKRVTFFAVKGSPEQVKLFSQILGEACVTLGIEVE